MFDVPKVEDRNAAAVLELDAVIQINRLLVDSGKSGNEILIKCGLWEHLKTTSRIAKNVHSIRSRIRKKVNLRGMSPTYKRREKERELENMFFSFTIKKNEIQYCLCCNGNIEGEKNGMKRKRCAADLDCAEYFVGYGQS